MSARRGLLRRQQASFVAIMGCIFEIRACFCFGKKQTNDIISQYRQRMGG